MAPTADAPTAGPPGGAAPARTGAARPGASRTGAARPAPAGIEPAPVTAWFAEHVPGTEPPLAFTLVAGGRSNLTYRVTDAAGRAWALRRPPLGHVLPTAHDMAREHRVLSALGPTPVPVPATYGLCTDEWVTGAPFYVMAFVEGAVVRDRAAAEAAFPVEVRRRIGDHMADTLAALHAVDVDAAGLGDLGRHQGYVSRQLRRWSEQYRRTGGPDQDHGPLMEEVGAALAAGVPEQRATAVVHGDYRLDNVVLDAGGQVAAVLDWEICTLGDPMADVGLLMVYWTGEDDEPLLGTAAPTAAPGFATRAQVLERYATTSGRDVGEVGYFTAFGYWKLACILQGVHARYVAGAGAGDQGSVEAFPGIVGRLTRLAAGTLEAR
ncbi:MAG: phosphotransferase family protein [Acidimicrobiales bacterium]